MIRYRMFLFTLTALALVPALGAQTRPPIRPLGAVHATTTDSLGVVNKILGVPHEN